MKKLMSLLAIILAGGCSQKADTSKDGISITDVRPDQPEFRRKYQTVVGDGFTVTVEMRSYGSIYVGGRMDSSEVRQRDGKWIYFDARRVADKIIDRELYPLVQAAVDRILAIDAEYVASKPSEFTDRNGTTWRRVDK